MEQKPLLGKITSHSKGAYQVVLADGAKIKAQLKAGESKTRIKLQATVGDQVWLNADLDLKQGLIYDVKPRKSLYMRKIKSKRAPQLVAANCDQLVVVTAIKQPVILLGLIARFIIAGTKGGLEIVIILNKSDLCTEQELDYYQNIFKKIGIKAFPHSIYQPKSLQPILKQFENQSILLVGVSGAGKSSLVNHINPNLNIKTAEIIDKLQKGRHTTSQVIAYDFQSFELIDTPGLRELHPIVELDWMKANYLPFFEYPKQCRFNRCSHLKEPDCAVKKALAAGFISEVWYKHYQSFYNAIS